MKIQKFLSFIIIVIIFSSACSSNLFSKPTPTGTSTATSIPTETSTPTATAIRTPPALPAIFQTTLLNPLDIFHNYIQDTCQSLHDKWNPSNSAPGTVVMVIMFHSITDVNPPPQPYDMLISDFNDLIYALGEDGFVAINTTQAIDFLEHNAKIPPLSVLLIADDRRTASYFNDHFRTYWENWEWPVVSAWISSPYNTPEQWQEQAELESEGWVDHQSHGVYIYAIDNSFSDSYILNEFNGSIAAFQEHFNKAPVAFIWPGGGFSPRAVELARQSGFRLGFTINPRGPLMYNLIPLADIKDSTRPLFIPEGPANDPLMVLPRYWSTDAIYHIDNVKQISQEATTYAEQNKASEMEFYDIVCTPNHGPIP